MNHTPEPWREHTRETLQSSAAGCAWLKLEDYERARACVNALAGVADPAAEVARLRESERGADALRQQVKLLTEESKSASIAFVDRLKEEVAAAAVMRQTLEWIQAQEKRGAPNYCVSVPTRRAVDASLEINVGRGLLAELSQLRIDHKAQREWTTQIRVERDNALAEVERLRTESAQARQEANK